MLINTVILFIRDTLPVFLLISLLAAQPGLRLSWIFAATLLGLILSGALYMNLSYLSQFAEGGGLELTKVIVLTLCFICLCEFTRRTHLASAHGHYWAIPLMAGITLCNAIHFIIYSVAYWPGEQADTGLILGTIIGIGISLSLCILLFTLVSTVHSHKARTIILVIFCAGQFAGIPLLLEQINFLSDSSRLWDTSAWIADDSEYGHLLNVLFGYEATPGLLYLLTYLATMSLPFAYAGIMTKLFSSQQIGASAK